MAEEWQIKGKNFLVTGGASGIGAKKVEALLKEGAEAVALLDIDEAGGTSIAEQHNKIYPGRVTFIKCDMADNDSVTRAFNQVLAKLKRIDAIINNAGILNEKSDGWSSTVDVNLKGVISMTRLGIGHMGKDKGGLGGTIVNVSSVGAFIDTNSVPIYCATKSAVLWFGVCTAAGDFYETTGVRILTICYGRTETPILKVAHKMLDEKSEKTFTDLMDSVQTQSPESAARGCMEMLKKGSDGSVWLSMKDEPAKEITTVLHTANKMLQDLVH